jgi:hypothetical protein
MKSLRTPNQLMTILLGIGLLLPVAYADGNLSDQASIEQVDVTHVTHRNRNIENSFSKSDEVLVTQLGDNNYAIVDVNGNRNQLSLMQKGNANNGDIQLIGNHNQLAAVQNGNGLNFGLKIDSDNRAYTLTQEKR